MNIIIRKAIPEEANRIIEINNIVWASTYMGILPNDVIEKKKASAQERIKEWTKSIEEKNNVYVAIDNDKIIGYQSYGKAFGDEFLECGEIYTSYILKEYHGKQIGRKMAILCMKELIKQGYNKLITRCLDENPFNSFHKSIGGTMIKQENSLIQDYHITENVYYHDNISESIEMNQSKIVSNKRREEYERE